MEGSAHRRRSARRYEDPVERLRWMAALAPALARDGISDDRRDELIGAIAGWRRQVDRRDPEAVLGAAAAIESFATAGIDPAGALYKRAGKARGERALPTLKVGSGWPLSPCGRGARTVAAGAAGPPRRRATPPARGRCGSRGVGSCGR